MFGMKVRLFLSIVFNAMDTMWILLPLVLAINGIEGNTPMQARLPDAAEYLQN